MLNKRKDLLIILTVAINIAGIGIVNARAQTSITPSARVKSFYTWYLKGERDVRDKDLLKYVTKRLYDKAKGPAIDGDMYSQEDAYTTFMNPTFTVGEEVIEKGRATVYVSIKGDPVDDPEIVVQAKLKISLLQEKGVWKISDVETTEEGTATSRSKSSAIKTKFR